MKTWPFPKFSSNQILPESKAFLLLLAIEIFIALQVHDDFIRPYVGDVLVVGLVYCFIRLLFKCRFKAALIATVFFCFVVEGLQLLDLTTVLELQSKVFRTVLGTAFSWADLLCYLVGAAIIFVVERQRERGAR